MIQTYGAEVFPSPSNRTQSGRGVLAQNPESPGSLGIAISEAVEDAATHDDAHYSLGSVLNHVLLHQTVIGQEALKQMEIAGEYPDTVIGCVGGGSNFAGLAFPFAGAKLREGKTTRIIAVEAEACPTLTKGTYAYDFGDTVGLTPLVKMHTLGHSFIPAAIHAGGLRYHGAAPLLSQLVDEGTIEARAYGQTSVFQAAIQFARSEGIIPAPESAHAIRAAVDEAMLAREGGERRVILFNLSGHGHFDMQAYTDYFAGKLEDRDYDEKALKTALDGLPKVA
jgi:tryptophan synthase beta chain